MTPEEALRNILSLVDGSDEVEDVHALQILLQSIRTLAEKGLDVRNDVPKFHVSARLLFAAACLCAPPAFADNLTGPASLTATRWRFTARVFGR